jgi:transposase
MWHNDHYSTTVSEKRIRKVAHIMIEDTQVVLVITQRRFRFHKHNTCKWELLPGIQKRGKTTDEFRKNSLRELQNENYSQVGKKRDVVIPSA